MAAIGDRIDHPISYHDTTIHCGGSSDGLPRRNNDTDYTLFEGMAVMGTGQTSGTVVRMDGSSIINFVLGIGVRPHGEGKDRDEPLANGEPLRVLPLNSATKAWVPIYPAAGPVPIDDGDTIIAHKTAAGYGQLLTDAIITGATAYPKLLQKIGIAQNPDTMADGATKVRWVRVKL